MQKDMLVTSVGRNSWYLPAGQMVQSVRVVSPPPAVYEPAAHTLQLRAVSTVDPRDDGVATVAHLQLLCDVLLLLYLLLNRQLCGALLLALGPLLLIMALWPRTSWSQEAGGTRNLRGLLRSVPWFAVGFVAVMALNSAALVPVEWKSALTALDSPSIDSQTCSQKGLV